MEQLHNRHYLKSNRKKLRNNSTPAEAGLWNLLKQSRLGRKFRRQHSVGNYILDFYCPEERLAIELDGQAHDSEEQYFQDMKRTQYLNNLGIKVLRFENKIVFEEPELLVLEIKRYFRH